VARAFARDCRIAGASLLWNAIDQQRELAFEDVKNLILAAVEVKRRRIALASPVLQDRYPILAIFGGNPDGHPRVEEP
jgi:hypothetical protein